MFLLLLVFHQKVAEFALSFEERNVGVSISHIRDEIYLKKTFTVSTLNASFHLIKQALKKTTAM